MFYIAYLISQLLGILPFSYDLHTGKAKTNSFITVYSAIMSIAMFGIIPLLWQVDWSLCTRNVPDLHIKINGLICLIRIAGVLVTVVLNWTERKEFMQTLNKFHRLRRAVLIKWPMSAEVENAYEYSLQSKFVWGIISNVFTIFGNISLVRNQFNVNSPLIAVLVSVMGTILNLILAHCFLAVVNVSALLAVINEEVKKSLDISCKLAEQQRAKTIKPGALITWCCKLADDLDELSVVQHRLIQLGERIHNMYDIQSACIMLDVYLTTISCIYMTYMLMQHEYLVHMYSVPELCAFPVTLAVYFWDLKIFAHCMLRYQELIKETHSLLREYQPPLPTLDVRLENSVSASTEKTIYK